MVHILLKPNNDQLARTYEVGQNGPGWFAAPIARVAPNMTFGRGLAELRQRARMPDQTFVVFNVGKSEAIALAGAFRKTNRVLSLHQWRPKHMSSAHSFFIRDRMLKRSEIILTYSSIDKLDLQERYPGADVRRLGHYVDTAFFDPALPETNEGFENLPGEYLLCVGDHLRLEDTLLELAQSFDLPLVRVSRDPAVRAFYESTAAGQTSVHMLPNVSFTKLRELYRRSLVAINAVDDRFWPVGITSFCESLSMGCQIVTSGNHSCAFYLGDNQQEPYTKVSDIFDKDCWTAALQGCLDGVVDPALARQTAVLECSLETVSQQWREAVQSSDSIARSGEAVGIMK